MESTGMTTINWTLTNGMTAEATITASASIATKHVNDGWGGTVDTGKREVFTTVQIVATLDGKREYFGSEIEPVQANTLGIVGGLGRIALKQDKYDEINAAIAAELDAVMTDEMRQIRADRLAAIKSSVAADVAADAAYNRIARA